VADADPHGATVSAPVVSVNHIRGGSGTILGDAQEPGRLSDGRAMTYCVGIWTRDGLVMASDSRTNAGHDQVNIARKMHTFVQPGERVFILLSSGSLSCTQSIITLLKRDFDQGKGLAQAPSLYDAARVIGEQVRRVSDMDRDALERDDFKFNVNLVLGGQVRGESPGLLIIYPQGNPLQASEDSPYLQIGETKYGRPILDRGIRFHRTTLEEAAKYALLSLDSTMRSNVTVGPPIDLLAYGVDEFEITRLRRFAASDPDLIKIGMRWEQALRQAVGRLPQIRFRARRPAEPSQLPAAETIELVEPGVSEPAGELQPQAKPPSS
jgi:putative proteasome-type protease